MRFHTAAPPHLSPAANVPQVMRQVLYALVPAAVAYVWYFGWGLIVNLVIASAVAIGCETLMLRLRERPVGVSLNDYSALVTAALLAFALPPLTPWWVTTIATAFAIVFAKHLYGGLGFNPFNPAMVGYVVVLVSFPAELNTWLAPRVAELGAYTPGPLETLGIVLTGNLPQQLTWDAVTMATPLDNTKTELGLMRTIGEIRASPLYGDFGGRGWEWINNWLIVGGVWLLYRGVIRWHIPVSMLVGLLVISTFFNMIDSDSHATPGFHLFSGAAIMGAFFIATDPVSAATSDKGRLVYGAGIGVLTYVIRTWGGYPDGVAFAVLAMNMAVPAIDHFTQPRVYGHGSR